MAAMRGNRIFVAALAMLAAIGIAQFGRPSASAFTQDPNGQAAVETYQLIKDRYLKKLPPEELKKVLEGSIRGQIDALDDPFTSYSPPRRTEIRNQDVRGEFFGIGVVIQAARPDGTGARILNVFRGGPAFRAGLQAGDEIVEVDREDVTNMDLFDIVSKIRGPKGSVVELGVRRKGSRAVLRFNITREKIEIVSVSKTMIGGDVGYVAIETFLNVKVIDQLNKAIQELKAQGAKKLILDLRDNGGGLLDQGCQVADAFLNQGVIVYTRSRDVTRPFCEASPTTSWSGPLVVLVNRNSASASEIVAGAIQDDGRGKIIGEKTFGKGVGQNVFTLANGGELTLVTFEWLTPKKRAIHGKGIQPDIAVKDTRFQEPLAFEGLGAPAGGQVELVVRDKAGKVIKRLKANVDEEGKFSFSEEVPPRPMSNIPGKAVLDLQNDAILQKALEVLQTP